MVKHPGHWIVALIWLLPSLGGGFLLWAMPDAVLGSRDAGSFISASASAGGPFSPPVTTVQTSQGTWVIDGAVSASRGQRLIVVDSSKDGMQMCASPDDCVPLSGSYVGAMHRISQAGLALSHDGWILWSSAALAWFFLGAFIFWLSVEFRAEEAKRGCRTTGQPD